MKQHRRAACVCAVLLLLVVMLPVAEGAAAGHTCLGDACPVCAAVAAVRVLRHAGWCAALAIVCNLYDILPQANVHVCDHAARQWSPVREKVRLIR